MMFGLSTKEIAILSQKKKKKNQENKDKSDQLKVKETCIHFNILYLLS